MRYLLFFWALGFPLFSSAQDSTMAAIDTPATDKDSVVFSKLDFASFQRLARFENKPYFIMFSASWCAPCQKIKSELFTNPQIATLANQNYLAFYMDLENFDDIETNSRYFKVSQLPTVLFFDPLGKQNDQAIGLYDGYYFFRKLRAHIAPSKWGPDWANE
jgi:thiol:disulfide interchange protein